MHQHVRIVLVDLDFLKNYSTFPLYIVGSKGRIQNEIGQDVERHGNVVGQ